MNGVMSAHEQRKGGIKPLCPVCTKKLKSNLKFDCKERYNEILKVCKELGFLEQAAIYQKLLDGAAASGIKARPRRVEETKAQPASTNIRTQLQAAPSFKNTVAPRASS